MSKPDTLDQQALEHAKAYMGEFAWPTVIFSITVIGSYFALITLAFTGLVSLWFACPILAVLVYLSYTVLHEAVHGSISGSRRNLRWINEFFGYLAAWITMIPLTAHRHEHLAHHRHTNDENGDPDFLVGSMDNSFWAAAVAANRVYLGQYTFYFSQRWHRAPMRQNVVFCLETLFAWVPRISLLMSGLWLESTAIFGLAWLLGVMLTLYLFAYLVHRPHKAVGRYVDTSTVLVEGPLSSLVTCLWVFQNYHAVHHLFPRVPFYHYRSLYEKLEDVMRAKRAPIYVLTASGMQAQTAASVETQGQEVEVA